MVKALNTLLPSLRLKMFQPILVLFLSSFVHSTYVLQDNYTPENFADMFSFFHDKVDPSGGFVNYVNREAAEQSGLYRIQNGKLYIGVDHENKSTDAGRNSVRLESKTLYNHGLFILDMDHMASSVCGSWPAYWLVGPKWPDDGEIDIIEGVNTHKTNQMTLHTNDHCSIKKKGNFTGKVQTSNCFDMAPGQEPHKGCSIKADRKETYGDGFNRAGGGVFATEWTSESIRMWHFTRNEIPDDIKTSNPNPSNWPRPVALFSGECDVDRHFHDQQIIFNLDFCGGWAESLWIFECMWKKGLHCKDYVRNHPNDFRDIYWLINYLKVYKKVNNTKNRNVLGNI